MKLSLFLVQRRFEFRHDLQNAVPAFLRLVDMEMKAGGVFDMESLVEFRLPLRLQHIGGMNHLGIRGGAIEVGNKNLGMWLS